MAEEHRGRDHRDPGRRIEREGDLRQVLGTEEGPAHLDLQPVRGVRKPDLPLQCHRAGLRGSARGPWRPLAPGCRVHIGHRLGRNDRRRRLPQEGVARLEDHRKRGAPVPHPASQRVRRAPHRGNGRQARSLGPQCPQHRGSPRSTTRTACGFSGFSRTGRPHAPVRPWRGLGHHRKALLARHLRNLQRPRIDQDGKALRTRRARHHPDRLHRFDGSLPLPIGGTADRKALQTSPG